MRAGLSIIESARSVATANPGYAFVNWTENGVPISSWPSSLVLITSNTTLVANFTAACTVATSPSSASAGTTAGDGAYALGSTVTVVATPKTGNAFVNWTENGQSVTNSPVYKFTGNGNRALVANFAASTQNVTFDFDTATPALTNSQRARRSGANGAAKSGRRLPTLDPHLAQVTPSPMILDDVASFYLVAERLSRSPVTHGNGMAKVGHKSQIRDPLRDGGTQ